MTREEANIFLPLNRKKELCNLVKYIAALLVVNGHLFLFGGYEGEAVRFMNLGAYCVSLFLFFSGYGLMNSYRRKGATYLKGFVSKRLSKLLIPLIVAYAVSLPVYAWAKAPVDFVEVLATLSWGGPYLRYSWYVSEVIVLYLMFYLVMKYIAHSDKGRLWLTAMVVLLMAVLFVSGQPTWYIVSLPGFIIGIWYERYECSIISRLNVIRGVAAIAIVGFCWFLCWQWNSCLGSYLTAYRYEYLAMYIGQILFVAFVVTVIVMMCSFHIPLLYTRIITSFYEVYLLQNCVMMIMGQCCESFAGYWAATMVGVIIVGYLANIVDGMLIRMLKL